MPAIPHGRRERQHAPGTGFIRSDLKFQHHLIERPLKDVRDVRALDLLGQPKRVRVQGFVELGAMKTKRILTPRNSLKREWWALLDSNQ